MNLREAARARMQAMIRGGLICDGRSYCRDRLPAIWCHLPMDVATDVVFNRLETRGYVALARVPDHDSTFEDLVGDCYCPVANHNINPNVLNKQERAERERILSEGVWGYEAFYCVDQQGPTNMTDSIWGFLGDDFWESGYGGDLKESALDALADAVGAPLLREAHEDPRQAAYVFMFTLQLMGLDVGGRLEDFRWP